MATGPQVVDIKTHPPKCAPAPKVLIALGVTAGHEGEWRCANVFFGMNGIRVSDRDNVKAEYRAFLDKSSFFRQSGPMFACSAIERNGESKASVFLATHAEFAARGGYKWRESYTRNALRSPRMMRRKGRQAVKGSVYEFAFGEGAKQWKDPNDYSQPTANEMRQNAEFAKYWRDTKAAYKGYSWIPGWIYDRNTPGTPYQKLVLLALAYHGLFKLDDEGHCAGELQKPLRTIGAPVGLSKDTVRDGIKFYEKLGLLQMVEHEVRPELNGQEVPEGTPGAKYRQPPNTIYYQAGREFNADKAQKEMDRFLAAAKPFREDPWFDVAAELHAAVLHEWIGTRQLDKTLHTECRRRLQSAGVPSHMIGTLFPKKPPG